MACGGSYQVLESAAEPLDITMIETIHTAVIAVLLIWSAQRPA